MQTAGRCFTRRALADCKTRDTHGSTPCNVDSIAHTPPACLPLRFAHAHTRVCTCAHASSVQARCSPRTRTRTVRHCARSGSTTPAHPDSLRIARMFGGGVGRKELEVFEVACNLGRSHSCFMALHLHVSAGSVCQSSPKPAHPILSHQYRNRGRWQGRGGGICILRGHMTAWLVAYVSHLLSLHCQQDRGAVAGSSWRSWKIGEAWLPKVLW